MQLVRMTRSERVDFDELARVLERDLALSAEVLRIVNCPALARGAPVTTLAQAVNRLGFSALREVATQAAMSVVIPPCESYAGAFESVHLHGVAVAHLTRAVGEAIGARHDAAFLAGLFHDVGLTAALMLLADVYDEDAPDVEQIWPELERVHGALGWRMCQLWELPPEVQRVARIHHDEPVEDVLGATVVLADHLATLGGAVTSLEALGGPPAALVDHARRVLEMEPSRLTSLERDAEALVDRALAGLG